MFIARQMKLSSMIYFFRNKKIADIFVSDVKLDMRHIIAFKVNNRSFYTPTSFKLVGVFYCKIFEMDVRLS